MSSIFHITRALRPTATLRPTPAIKTMPSHFFNSGSTSRLVLGLNSSSGPTRIPCNRFYSSYNYHSTSKTNMRILYGLIGINCGIFSYAMYLKSQAQQGYQKPFIVFMRNFSLNLNGVLREGRWWTILTSAFTQVDPMHLLGNMVSIYFLGEIVARTPGVSPMRLLSLVFGSAITGSLGYLAFRAEKAKATRGIDYNRGIGFSGVVTGVGAAAACLYPHQKMLIYGIVPVPLWALMLGYAVLDGYYLNDERSRVGHAGHLGGLAFGLAFYFARLRGLRGF